VELYLYTDRSNHEDIHGRGWGFFKVGFGNQMFSSLNVKMASNFPKVKWEYDLADSVRVICGLVPKKLPETPKFDPWNVKTYKVEDCTQELLDYQKKLAEKGLKDPWIR
jgi:hypothetical protein